jgi:hypothetical protein
MPTLTEREARFAEHYAVYDDPAAAWEYSGEVKPGTKRRSMQMQAYRMRSLPHVRNRIVELRNSMAAAGPVATKAALLRDLEESAAVDVREIFILTKHHCPACYASAAYVAWWANALADAAEHGEPVPAAPMAPGTFDSTRKPWSECAGCAGAGRPVTHYTSFDELSPAARRLLRGIEMNSDGGIKRVLITDPNELSERLHRTVPGFYAPTTSVSLNLHAEAKPLKGLSVEEALAIMDSVAPPPPDEPHARIAPDAIDATFEEVQQ